MQTIRPTKITLALVVLVLASVLAAMVVQHNNCLDQTAVVIRVIEEARETHLPWIRYLGESLPGVPEVGDIMFHLEVVQAYDMALEALESACSYPGG